MPSRSSQDARERTVALFGTFDTENFGDCLFPLIFEQQLAKRIEGLNLLLFSPTSRAVKTAAYGKVHAFAELGHAFDATLPAFVIGGGALLATEHVLFSYPEIRLTYPYSLKCWLLPAMAASFWKCPLILGGVGLGPFDASYSGLAAKYLKQADVLGVRDGITQRFLGGLGAVAEIVPDPGILTPELDGESERNNRYQSLKTEFDLPDRYIAVQSSLFLGSRLYSFAAAVAEGANEAGLPVVLIPICHHLNDLVALRIMRRTFRHKATKTVLIGRILNALETSTVLSKAALYVGTSLHGALVTISFGRPIVSFSLRGMKKNSSVLAVLGAEDCVVNEVSDISSRICETLNGPERQHAAGVEDARKRLAAFFDRVAKVILLESGMPLSRPLNMDISSGEGLDGAVKDDLDQVKSLCVRYRQSVPLIRRCAAFVVRNNRTASECYDRVSHWLTVRRGEPEP